MRALVAGASGFIGRALVAALRNGSHDVRRLVRSDDRRPDAVSWTPARGMLDPTAVADVDAIVNLAGENISRGRWTRPRRERILRSRVDATATLVNALARAAPRPRVLVNASAAGFYGDRGDAPVTEATNRGAGFLADVCDAWEREAEQAAALGVRAVRLRFGVVLDGEGGALGKMLPFFRAGLGGRLGAGRQWMSWIARDDVIGVIQRALSDDRYTGAINVGAPNPVTNADFTHALGRVLHRPTVLPVPAWALRLMFGRAMANEALLASTRMLPARLQELGYEFQLPEIEPALRMAVA